MTKYLDVNPRQTARSNRERLTPLERPAIMEEIAKAAADVRANMERLRELRLTREAQKIRTETFAGDQRPKAKPWGPVSAGRQQRKPLTS